MIFSVGEGGEQFTFARGQDTESVSLRPRLRVSVAEGLRAAVRAGLGVAVATEWIFGPELTDGTLQVVLPEWQLPPIDLWAILPAGRGASANARAFVAFVESELESTPFAPRARKV